MQDDQLDDDIQYQTAMRLSASLEITDRHMRSGILEGDFVEEIVTARAEATPYIKTVWRDNRKRIERTRRQVERALILRQFDYISMYGRSEEDVDTLISNA